MNEEEIAKFKKLFKKVGLNQKQIKSIIENANKKNMSAEDLATVFVFALDTSLASDLSFMASLFKNKVKENPKNL